MERTRRETPLCVQSQSEPCVSTVTRFIWAGDQLLWELRAPGQSSADPEAVTGSGAWYRQVSYFHAGGIDKPLLISKDGVGSLVPRDTWRGQFHAGTSPTTGLRGDCTGSTPTGCIWAPWPGWQTTASHAQTGTAPDVQAWFGGLVDGMRGAGGQMYMRNRNYDPTTRQFTQTDPIGLAGGLNGYGFADGDPVSYSDPYGLCAAKQARSSADPDEPGRVCPGGLTHGEYYQREDGFWVGAPTARNRNAREGSGAIGGEILAMAQRDYLKGCSNTSFEISMPMGNTSRRMQRFTVGTWDMTLKRTYRDYYLGPVRVLEFHTGKYGGRYTSSNFPRGLDASATVLCDSGYVFFHADADDIPDHQPDRE